MVEPDQIRLTEVTEPDEPHLKRKQRAKVVVFGMWCKGCGLCVEFCPTNVLVLDEDDHPVVVAEEKCTACHWCDTHCPDFAIVVERIA